MLDEVFDFKDDQVEGIQKKVAKEKFTKKECLEGIRLLEKQVNVHSRNLQTDIPDLRLSAGSDKVYTTVLEHVFDSFCVLLNGEIKPIGNLSGIALAYSQLPMKLEDDIKDMINDIHATYSVPTEHPANRTLASEFHALLQNDEIMIMDAVNVVFFKTFSKKERYDLSSGNAPVMKLFQAVGRDKTVGELRDVLNLLIGKREQWPAMLYDYAYAWICRNIDIHDAKNLDDTLRDQLKRGFWHVLLDCCLRYQEQINQKFREELVELINPDAFKEELKEKKKDRLAFHEKKYTQLTWGGSKNIKWTKGGPTTLLLLGEAGAGKTTQMEHLYVDILNDAEDKVYPMWIRIQDMHTSEVDKSLKTCIKDILKESCAGLDDYYDILMREGYVILFLDGLNELLVDDRGAMKKELLDDISAITEQYENVRMCITDRIVQGGMDKWKGVKVYRCAAMKKEEQEEYCNRVISNKDSIKKEEREDSCKKVRDYLDININPQSRWINRDPMTPQKMDVLIDMLLDKRVSDTYINDYKKAQNLFWYRYVDAILEREMSDKRDFDRVDDLKVTFRRFLKNDTRGYNECKFTEAELIDFFCDDLDINSRTAREYYQLVRSIPLVVNDEVEKDKLYFAHFSYHYYFKKGNNLKYDVR